MQVGSGGGEDSSARVIEGVDVVEVIDAKGRYLVVLDDLDHLAYLP